MTEVLASHIPHLIVMAFLLGCSSFFSGSETALFNLRPEHLQGYEQRHGRAGRRVLQLLAEPRLLLATVLVGNTVVNVLFYCASFTLAMGVAAKAPVAAGFMGLASLFLVIVFGEVAPKGLAVSHPEAVARLAATPLYWFQRAVMPAPRAVVAILRLVCERLVVHMHHDPPITADELKMLVGMAAQQRALAGGAQAMIQDVVDLSQTRVKRIMVPRVDTVCFPVDAGRERFLELARQTRHKRYPVYRVNRDDIFGVLHARDVLLNPTAELASLARPVSFVPETMTVERLLHVFREQRQSLAVVVDEFGGTAGLVTIEDVIEEIVGEIQDERDRTEQRVQRLGPATYVLSGDLSVESWADMFGLDLPPANVQTLGGAITALLGRMPEEGDSVRIGGLEFTVDSMRRRRIERVRLRLLPFGGEEVRA